MQHAFTAFILSLAISLSFPSLSYADGHPEEGVRVTGPVVYKDYDTSTPGGGSDFYIDCLGLKDDTARDVLLTADGVLYINLMHATAQLPPRGFYNGCPDWVEDAETGSKGNKQDILIVEVVPSNTVLNYDNDDNYRTLVPPEDVWVFLYDGTRFETPALAKDAFREALAR